MRWLALAAVFLGVACSSNGASNNDASGTGGTGGGGPKSCIDIRRCTVEAGCVDSTCLTNCKQGASADAMVDFDALETCLTTTAGCTRDGTATFRDCFCEAECQTGQLTCGQQVDDCLADPLVVDQVCDICF
jgi:hypothetical protein